MGARSGDASRARGGSESAAGSRGGGDDNSRRDVGALGAAPPGTAPASVDRPLDDHLGEARRVMTICNACRYCEGFCAVFPAMELRRTFSDADLGYLANLCHDCRGCYHACQYAPPHEFAVNVPRALAAVRADSYAATAWPAAASRLMRRNGPAVAWITAAAVAVVALLTVLRDPALWWARHVEPGAFYVVIPYAAMVVPASAIGLFAVVALGAGALRFWRRVGGGWRELTTPSAVARAVGDALLLRYLDGGGPGCTYPEERASRRRKWLHQLVFWGFALDLAATSVAAFYHHGLHREAPYPLLSLPVVLGTVGGVALLVGASGLLLLKRRADPGLVDPRLAEMDVAFLALLFLTSLTGLTLLALRETVLMGILLAVHLGVVAGLFLTLPYGKLVHAGYRFLALVRFAREQGEAEGG